MKSNPRNFYKTCRPFLDEKGKGNGGEGICLNINGKLERDQQKVAEHLANYFSRIADGIGGDKVGSLTEHDIQTIKAKTESDTLEEAFEFSEVTIKEVEDALTRINTRKAVCFDNLHPRILKSCAKEIAPSLTGILNMSIRVGVWPANWKLGEWIPIYKKDDRMKDINYRPVTVLSSVDKVYEKLLSSQTTGFMEPKMSYNMTA